MPKSSKTEPDKGRRRQLETFARVLRKTVNECRAKGDKHVPVMHCVGYAIKGGQRLNQHNDGGASSGWLLQLIVAIMEAMRLEPNVGYHFVAFISSDDVNAAAIGEIVVTRFGRAYYYAGSFSIGKAGASTSSSRTMSKKAREEALSWIYRKTPYRDNQEKEKGRRQNLQRHEYDEELNAEEAKVENLGKDVQTLIDVAKRPKLEELRAERSMATEMFDKGYAELEEMFAYRKKKLEEISRWQGQLFDTSTDFSLSRYCDESCQGRWLPLSERYRYSCFSNNTKAWIK